MAGVAQEPRGADGADGKFRSSDQSPLSRPGAGGGGSGILRAPTIGSDAAPQGPTSQISDQSGETAGCEPGTCEAWERVLRQPAVGVL
jgi:hypothetical protein